MGGYGVVEVVALLGSRGASAAAARLGRSLLRSRRRLRISLAQSRAAINAQRGVVLSSNTDIAPIFAFGWHPRYFVFSPLTPKGGAAL